MLQANSSLTPAQIYSILQQSATPANSSATPVSTPLVPNFASGYGFVNAAVAATKTPVTTVPAAPTLSLAKSSIAVGASTTLTWSSSNNTGCTASGSWSGAQPSAGSQTITASTAGTNTYSLICTNVAGNSPTASATLTITAAGSTPPTAPNLTISTDSIVVGGSATLTWSSAGATGCTASGSWSGALATSGTQTVTPASAGTDTYLLMCSNAAGNSTATTVILTVTAAATGGGSHGGGGIDAELLLGPRGTAPRQCAAHAPPRWSRRRNIRRLRLDVAARIGVHVDGGIVAKTQCVVGAALGRGAVSAGRGPIEVRAAGLIADR